MPVVIRMARAGTKKRPVYHIVVADSRSPRDGRFIERLGYFNPLLPKDNKDRLKFDLEKVKAWIAKGAQPSDRVMRFLDAAGVAKREKRNNPEKAVPRKERKARPKPRRRPPATPRPRAKPRPRPRPTPSPPKRRRRAECRRRRASWPSRICVAQIGAAHGIRGEVRCARSPRIRRRSRPTARSKPRTARALRDRGAAAGEGRFRRAARGRERSQRGGAAHESQALRAARPAAADGDGDTFYHADLIGLAAVTPDGAALGKVIAIHQFRRRRSGRDHAGRRRRDRCWCRSAMRRCRRSILPAGGSSWCRRDESE